MRDWRSGNLKPTGSSRLGPRDPPFRHPSTIHSVDEDDAVDDDEESAYHEAPSTRPGVSLTDTTHNASGNPFSDSNRYSSGVPSGYASPPRTHAGGDIAPSRPSMDAYGAFSDPAPTGFAPQLAPAQDEPRVSRTMQYADPYAAVRASITPPAPSSPSGASGRPPSYESYSDYR
jgi:hypothetical protein